MGKAAADQGDFPTIVTTEEFVFDDRALTMLLKEPETKTCFRPVRHETGRFLLVKNLNSFVYLVDNLPFGQFE